MKDHTLKVLFSVTFDEGFMDQETIIFRLKGMRGVESVLIVPPLNCGCAVKKLDDLENLAAPYNNEYDETHKEDYVSAALATAKIAKETLAKEADKQ